MKHKIPMNACKWIIPLLTCLSVSAQDLTESKIVSTSTFGFTLTDLDPTDVSNPTSFTVSVDGFRGGWQIPGGDGIFQSTITSPPIAVSSEGALQLTFQHRYNFENEYDGGFVQYNINGEGWTTVEEAAFTEEGYYPVPLIGNGFQLGKLGFNGRSFGFEEKTLTTSIATLPTVAPGAVIQLRFLAAFDEGESPAGIDWDISQVTLKVGATVVSNQSFGSSDGGYVSAITGEANSLPWNHVPGSQPVLGGLTASKSDGVLTLTQAIQWASGTSYMFTISGKNSFGSNLVYETTVTTPILPLAAAREWPKSFPGPLGTAGNWGIRTYLNQGINTVDSLQSMLDFLAAASNRTPVLSPTNVVDAFAPSLHFADKNTNAALQGVLLTPPLPFPGEALSTSNNSGSIDDNYVITTAHGTIQITEESDYTFNIRCDDGYVFRIKSATGAPPKFLAVNGPSVVDAVAQNVVYFPSGTGDANTRAVVHLTPGLYKLEFAQWEAVGGFYYQITAAKGFFLENSDTDVWAPFNRFVDRTTPIPYPSMVGNWTVQSTEPGGSTIGTLLGANNAVSAAVAANSSAATSTWEEINFIDPQSGGGGRIGGDSPFPRDTDADDDNFALRMSGTLRIPEDGNYLFGFQGDDGSDLTIGGVHSGFSALVEDATGAGVIGRQNTIAVNTGSLGAAANFSAATSAVWSRPGAIVGDPNNGIRVTAADGQRTAVPFVSDLNPASSFTVEVWVKPSIIPGDLTCAVSSGNFADPRSGWLIYMDPAGGWSFRGFTGVGLGTAFNVAGGEAPVAGQWYHLVGTWNSSTTTATLFVNNVQIGQEVVTAPAYANAVTPISNGSLNLGSRSDGFFTWEGDIDELAVYPSALTSAQVGSHYTNALDAARTTPYATLVASGNPLGYWRLNETQQPRTALGTIIADVPTGNSSTVGRIFLTAGDYPISSTFFEIGGGAHYEIFASRDQSNQTVPFRTLKTDGWPSVPVLPNGLLMAAHPTPMSPTLVGGLTVMGDRSLSLTFRSNPYDTYNLQTSSDLVNWSNLVTEFEATSTTTTFLGDAGNSFFFLNPLEKNRFYRVLANP